MNLIFLECDWWLFHTLYLQYWHWRCHNHHYYCGRCSTSKFIVFSIDAGSVHHTIQKFADVVVIIVADSFFSFYCCFSVVIIVDVAAAAVVAIAALKKLCSFIFLSSRWCHQTLQQIYFKFVVFSFIFRNHVALKKGKHKIGIASSWCLSLTLFLLYLVFFCRIFSVCICIHFQGYCCQTFSNSFLSAFDVHSSERK